jgi:hypothetical protein
MNTYAEEAAYGVVNMTSDKHVQFRICLSEAGIEATTLSMADTDRIVIQPEREIHGITFNHQMRYTKEFSILLVQCISWWPGIGIQELWKMITQRVILFGYAMMHLLCHIWKPIWGIGSSDNVTTNISERLHIGNFKEVYQSTNIVNYIQQLHKDNEQCTGLDYTEETVLHLARLA